MPVLFARIDQKSNDELEELLHTMRKSRTGRVTKQEFITKAVKAYVEAWQRKMGGKI